jgi:hypothetical protein
MEETQNEAKLSAGQGRRQAGKIEVRELKPEEEERFEELMAQRHYLGEAKRTGRKGVTSRANVRQRVTY